MRKLVKIQILKLIDDLKKNNDKLIIATKQHYQEKKTDILIESQEIIMDIANEIGNYEGENHYIIKKLENYYNVLYKYSELDKKAEKLNELKLMSKNIEQIKNDIKRDIPEQNVIVFFPYLASMWDSLESVWDAAKEDENCICFVVPIPYFEKKADGTLGDMHYEGDSFPENIPITDYRNFELEKIYPEIIYFHNPYDEYNFVTTVHPDYYSSKLKNYTNMLVYIPYFVATTNMSSHFVRTSGVYNADRVIVQSNQIREIYIKEYKKSIIENETKKDKKFLNELDVAAKIKFLALGSPKFDKLNNFNYQNNIMPDEWGNKLFNKDGSKKKVILYNTTISALLENRERYIEKIKSVIYDFSKNDNFVLWWRPHPLMEATISSMIPYLKDEYLEIVNDYRDRCLGVYDDSSDLSRAIFVSDMYYGDKSSVVELYKSTNKPVLIQNVDYNNIKEG